MHLVIDTAGSAKFWNTVEASEWRDATQTHKPASIEDQPIPFEQDKKISILTENYNSPLVMHPGEVDALIVDIVSDMRACQSNLTPLAQAFEKTLHDFRREWRRLWSLYGQSEEGWIHYEHLIKSVYLPNARLQLASNQGSAVHTFGARVLAAALTVSLADQYRLS